MKTCSRVLVCFAVASVFFTTPQRKAAGEDFDIGSLQAKIFETFEQVKPAVVSLSSGGSMFSGVIVSPDGHVLSAGHAVTPGNRYQVLLPDGRRLRGIGKGCNQRADCALVKITGAEEDLPYVRMGDSTNLATNQPCLSVSFPGGQGTRGVPTVRFGRVVRSGGFQGMLQSTALMEPGDSGGALFDLDGRVIGIHSRIGRSMDRNYEVPIAVYQEFWNELNHNRYFDESGPPPPKLGFRGFEERDGSGIVVTDVLPDTLASKNGIQRQDLIQTVYGEAISSIRELRRALIAARDDGADKIVVSIVRKEEEVELEIDFDIVRDAAPEAKLPEYEDKEFGKPSGIKELTKLPQQFAELESKLDDTCVAIYSLFGDQDDEYSIVGTKLKDTRLIVSKSSMVGRDPQVDLSDKTVDLEIVARDSENDLVLLRAPEPNADGIGLEALNQELPASDQAGPKIGLFLLTPDEDGQGLVSVVSTRSFRSRKQQSRGFLGVVPDTYKDGGAVLNEVTDDGAAKRAGLKAGDVVIKMNETEIKTQMDMRNFLSSVDPNITITALVLRGDKELTKSITLGAMPSFSGHAADRMDKSARRDGFTQVIPHDADLQPEDCGSPLFDLQGNFIGLNIARNSRVRSYALPAKVIKDLLDSVKDL